MTEHLVELVDVAAGGDDGRLDLQEYLRANPDQVPAAIECAAIRAVEVYPMGGVPGATTEAHTLAVPMAHGVLEQVRRTGRMEAVDDLLYATVWAPLAGDVLRALLDMRRAGLAAVEASR